MTRPLALVLLATLVSCAVAAEQKPAASDRLRALGSFPVDLSVDAHTKLFTRNSAYAFDSEKEAAKVFGAELGAALVRGVDFEKEQAVVIAWMTGGPPYGTLKWRDLPGATKPTIEFFIKAPKAGARGEAAQYGVDRFAVPKGVLIQLDSVER